MKTAVGQRYSWIWWKTTSIPEKSVQWEETPPLLMGFKSSQPHTISYDPFSISPPLLISSYTADACVSYIYIYGTLGLREGPPSQCLQTMVFKAINNQKLNPAAFWFLTLSDCNVELFRGFALHASKFKKTDTLICNTSFICK